MIYQGPKSIVNLREFRRDISSVISKGEQRVRIESPATNTNSEITVKDFENLMKEVIKLSSGFPHRKCALIYKINENSSLCLEIHPVTDAA